MTPLERAIRAGCDVDRSVGTCRYPDCLCEPQASRIGKAILAAALADDEAEKLADLCGREWHEVVDVLAALRRVFDVP